MFNKRNLIILAAVVLLVIAGLFYSGVIKLSKPKVLLAPYSNPFFGISLEYPQGWEVDVNGGAFAGVPLRFVGSTGYFGIDALAADDKFSIDELVNAIVVESATTSTAPYGTKPIVESGALGDKELRIVIPSKDQPVASKNEAIALIRYPEQIKIGDNFFRYLIIYSDSAHIKDIVSSLKFVASSVPSQQ